jgi:hypothetical protein
MDVPVASDRSERIEQALGAAVELARRQNSRSFELRAITTRARWWRQTGRAADALAELTQVLDGFTQGFDTVDYRDAQAERDSLALAV